MKKIKIINTANLNKQNINQQNWNQKQLIEVSGSKQLSRVRIQEFLSVSQHNHVDMGYALYTDRHVTQSNKISTHTG